MKKFEGILEKEKEIEMKNGDMMETREIGMESGQYSFYRHGEFLQCGWIKEIGLRLDRSKRLEAERGVWCVSRSFDT